MIPPQYGSPIPMSRVLEFIVRVCLVAAISFIIFISILALMEVFGMVIG